MEIQLTETSKMIKEIGDSKTKTAIITHTHTDRQTYTYLNYSQH